MKAQARERCENDECCCCCGYGGEEGEEDEEYELIPGPGLGQRTYRYMAGGAELAEDEEEEEYECYCNHPM